MDFSYQVLCPRKEMTKPKGRATQNPDCALLIHSNVSQQAAKNLWEGSCWYLWLQFLLSFTRNSWTEPILPLNISWLLPNLTTNMNSYRSSEACHVAPTHAGLEFSPPWSLRSYLKAAHLTFHGCCVSWDVRKLGACLRLWTPFRCSEWRWQSLAWEDGPATWTPALEEHRKCLTACRGL